MSAAPCRITRVVRPLDALGWYLNLVYIGKVWDRLIDVAPFAFRVLDDINAYVVSGTTLGATWQECLDDQLLQKNLPKLGGAEDKVGAALDWMAAHNAADFPPTHAKAAAMPCAVIWLR